MAWDAGGGSGGRLLLRSGCTQAAAKEQCRNRGIAGRLLEHVCRDMAARHVMTLYLVTDHTAFYERYGWEFMCMVQGDDGNMIRMYRRASVPGKKL